MCGLRGHFERGRRLIFPFAAVQEFRKSIYATTRINGESTGPAEFMVSSSFALGWNPKGNAPVKSGSLLKYSSLSNSKFRPLFAIGVFPWRTYSQHRIANHGSSPYSQILDTTPQKRVLVCWEQSVPASPFKLHFGVSKCVNGLGVFSHLKERNDESGSRLRAFIHQRRVLAN